jgi:hypothetical protein
MSITEEGAATDGPMVAPPPLFHSEKALAWGVISPPAASVSGAGARSASAHRRWAAWSGERAGAPSPPVGACGMCPHRQRRTGGTRTRGPVTLGLDSGE